MCLIVSHRFPLGTFIINVSGSFLIGVLMTLLTERLQPHPNWRLFLVVGILGGVYDLLQLRVRDVFGDARRRAMDGFVVRSGQRFARLFRGMVRHPAYGSPVKETEC